MERSVSSPPFAVNSRTDLRCSTRGGEASAKGGVSRKSSECMIDVEMRRRFRRVKTHSRPTTTPYTHQGLLFPAHGLC